jgi:hypothetical protein
MQHYNHRVVSAHGFQFVSECAEVYRELRKQGLLRINASLSWLLRVGRLGRGLCGRMDRLTALRLVGELLIGGGKFPIAGSPTADRLPDSETSWRDFETAPIAAFLPAQLASL